MSIIQSIRHSVPTNRVSQFVVRDFAKNLFSGSSLNIDRLLPVFENTSIESRPVLMDLEWYGETKTFQEKNALFVEHSLNLAKSACEDAIRDSGYSKSEIGAIIVVSTSGFVTPGLDARLIDLLGLSDDIIRIPLVGLGCAGGVYGLARARELSFVYPDINILLVAVETCTLTFRPADKRKANLIALSLFSDGASALVISNRFKKNSIRLLRGHSKKYPNSLNIMGWDIEQDGLQVVFDRSIPSLILQDFAKVFHHFVNICNLQQKDIKHYLFHPGGKKVLDAFEESLQITQKDLHYSHDVLRNFGNVSSPTVYFVIEEFLKYSKISEVDKGIMAAMGPGFSAELMLFETTGDTT